ncbi:MAG: hypothetical protein CK425_01645 [Parachlamydia sp.]|nr:MAG: hypothetical protein CK425_01645 [Parachlamydia sp.]
MTIGILPPEILSECFLFLTIKDLCLLSSVSKKIQEIADSSFIWKKWVIRLNAKISLEEHPKETVKKVYLLQEIKKNRGSIVRWLAETLGLEKFHSIPRLEHKNTNIMQFENTFLPYSIMQGEMNDLPFFAFKILQKGIQQEEEKIIILIQNSSPEDWKFHLIDRDFLDYISGGKPVDNTILNYLEALLKGEARQELNFFPLVNCGSVYIRTIQPLRRATHRLAIDMPDCAGSFLPMSS